MTPGDSVDNPVARTFTPPREGEVIQHEGCNYFLGKYIGEGSWGVVFHCTDDWENELVAKILKPRNRTYEAAKDEWVKELSNLVKLRQRNGYPWLPIPSGGYVSRRPGVPESSPWAYSELHGE